MTPDGTLSATLENDSPNNCTGINNPLRLRILHIA